MLKIAMRAIITDMTDFNSRMDIADSSGWDANGNGKRLAMFGMVSPRGHREPSRRQTSPTLFIVELFRDNQFAGHLVMAGSTKVIAMKVKSPNLLWGKLKPVSLFPGLMSVRIPRAGQLKPCTLSSDVNSSTTGTPFLTVITLGEYSNFFAVT